MARTKTDAVYVARTSGTRRVDGVLYRYTRGVTHFAADHPLVKRHPEVVEPMSVQRP